MKNLKIETRIASNKWIYAIVLTLLFQLTGFAQAPGDFDGVDPPPAAPIDDYVWVLMTVGIAFAFYTYKVKSKQNKASDF